MAEFVFIFSPFAYHNQVTAPNGWRYPLVGGTRQCRFNGTNLKPYKLPENAQTPTSRVHALLGELPERKPRRLEQATTAKLTKLWHTAQTFATDKKHDLLDKSCNKLNNPFLLA
jgi:hypothetical protein